MYMYTCTRMYTSDAWNAPCIIASDLILCARRRRPRPTRALGNRVSVLPKKEALLEEILAALKKMPAKELKRSARSKAKGFVASFDSVLAS